MTTFLWILAIPAIYYVQLGLAFAVYTFKLGFTSERLDLPPELRSSFTLWDYILQEYPDSATASLINFVLLFLLTCFMWAEQSCWETTWEMRVIVKRKSAATLAI